MVLHAHGAGSVIASRGGADRVRLHGRTLRIPGCAPELVERERRLFDRADVVFAGGASLYAAKTRQHDNVHLFPSSVDKAHFGQPVWGRRTRRISGIFLIRGLDFSECWTRGSTFIDSRGSQVCVPMWQLRTDRSGGENRARINFPARRTSTISARRICGTAQVLCGLGCGDAAVCTERITRLSARRRRRNTLPRAGRWYPHRFRMWSRRMANWDWSRLPAMRKQLQGNRALPVAAMKMAGWRV